MAARRPSTSALSSQSRTGGRRAPTLPHLVNVVVSTPFSPAKTLSWLTAGVRGRSSPSASAVACDTVTTASAAVVTRQGRGEEAEGQMRTRSGAAGRVNGPDRKGDVGECGFGDDAYLPARWPWRATPPVGRREGTHRTNGQK